MAGKLDNQVALFGGINSTMLDYPAFAAAWQMEKEGRPREEIWEKTGFFMGPDGKWRYEIDDSQMQVSFGKGTVGDLVNHPWLAAYPQVKDIPLEVRSQEPFGWEQEHGFLDRNGMYVQANDERRAKHITTHELQHAIQNIEGFDRGAAPVGFKPEKGGERVSWDEYLKSRGEIEARVAAFRSNLTPEQRKQIPPWILWDYLLNGGK